MNYKEEANRRGRIIYKSHQIVGYADNVTIILNNISELKEVT